MWKFHVLRVSVNKFFFRHLRRVTDETPTHTGGLSYEARLRLEERNRHKGRGVAASTKDNKFDDSKSFNKGKFND